MKGWTCSIPLSRFVFYISCSCSPKTEKDYISISVTNTASSKALVVECWHQVQEVLGSIPSQGPPHIKDKDKNGTSYNLVQH